MSTNIDCPKCNGTGNACEKCDRPELHNDCKDCPVVKHWYEGGYYEYECPECYGTGNVDID